MISHALKNLNVQILSKASEASEARNKFVYIFVSISKLIISEHNK